MPSAPAHQYRETYREADLKKLISDFDIPHELCHELRPILEDSAAIWRWKNSNENSFKAPATTSAAIRRVAKKAGSLKDALEGLPDQAFVALNRAYEQATDRAALDESGVASGPALSAPTEFGTDGRVYPDLEEITQLIAVLEKIALDVPLPSTTWKGPRKSSALGLWIANIAMFWTDTLSRDFTRDISDTGEPISPAARFCVEAFALLSPDTPTQTVLNAMKAHITSAKRKRLAK